MIRAVLLGLAFAAAALAACSETDAQRNERWRDEARDQTTTTVTQNNITTDTGLIGEDTCGMAAHRDLIGKAESEIDRSSLPAGARVICFGCMVTMDYSAQRLNIRLDPNHKVASLRCG